MSINKKATIGIIVSMALVIMVTVGIASANAVDDAEEEVRPAIGEPVAKADGEFESEQPAPAKIKRMVGGPFLNTSPDLPWYDDKEEIRPYFGTSPDLPELNFDEARPKVRSMMGDNFGGGSPDLPWTEDTRFSGRRAYVGSDPEEDPELFHRSANVSARTYAGISPDLPDLTFDALKVARVGQALPLESFAYFSIDGINSVH